MNEHEDRYISLVNKFKERVTEDVNLIPEAYDFAVDRILIRTDIGDGFHGRYRKLMSVDEAVDQVVDLFERADWNASLMGIFSGLKCIDCSIVSAGHVIRIPRM